MKKGLALRELPWPQGFVVVNGEGARVSPAFTRRDQALRWFERRAMARPPKRRPCMCCGRIHESEGIHDRLCPTCGRAGASFGGAAG